jgi:hypothetical protein
MHDQGPKPSRKTSRVPHFSLPLGEVGILTSRTTATPAAENSKPQPSSVPLRALCGEPVAPWIPESKLPQVPLNPTNSFVRKILLTTPEFPRFYADVILATRPNSREARLLRPHYQKILEKVNAMSNDRSCTHIRVTGVRCNSPALRGEQFCYFHQNAHRGVRRPPQSRLHPIAMIEDEESIQYALMEVINALMRNTIDVKRATLIIRALHIAVKNAARVKFGIHAKDTVTQVPEYAPPTEQHEAIAQQSELPAVSAIPYKPVEPTNPHFWEYSEEGARVLAREAQARKSAETQAANSTDRVETDRVGTGAFARPAQSKPSASVGTDALVRPGHEATVPLVATTTTPNGVAAAVPPHNFKKPATVALTPHERKSKAHAANRG